MDYIIYTPSAMRLKKEIFNATLPLADDQNKSIVTWRCVKTEANDTVLVHTLDRWFEKGCITFKENRAHNELQVRFCYWDSCEDRTNNDERYMLGRFTELLLVHCFYFLDKIVIK